MPRNGLRAASFARRACVSSAYGLAQMGDREVEHRPERRDPGWVDVAMAAVVVGLAFIDRHGLG